MGEQDWKPFNSEAEKIMKQGNVHIKTTKRKGSSPDLTTAKPKAKDLNKTVPQRRDSERIANIQSYVEALKLRSATAEQLPRPKATSSGHPPKLTVTSGGDYFKPIAPPGGAIGATAPPIGSYLSSTAPPFGTYLRTTAPPIGNHLKTKAPPGVDPPKSTAPPVDNSKTTATPGVDNPDLTWASPPSFSKTVASFSCQDREAGFYADTELGCRVYHHCGDGGYHQRFSCPKGMAYSESSHNCVDTDKIDCRFQNEQRQNNNVLLEPINGLETLTIN